MDIQEKQAFESNFRTTEIYRRECVIRGRDILEFSKTMNGYFNIIANEAWRLWQAAKAQAVPEWISVEDGLPSDGQDIIAFDAIKHCVFKDGEFLQGYIESDTGYEYEEPVEVTHWMAVEAREPAND